MAIIKSEKIVIASNNIKPELIESGVVYNAVRWLIRNFEFEKALKNKAWIEASNAFDKFPLINKWEVSKEECFKLIPEIAMDFIKIRDDIKELQDELANIAFSQDVFDALELTDKVCITLQAHKACKALKINKKWVDVDMKKVVEAYYNKGGLSETKKALLPIFNNLVGKEGSLFNAVKVRKSTFTDSDIRHYLGMFTKGSATDKNNLSIWNTPTGKDFQLSVLTDFLAVVIDGKGVEVVKTPESK